MANKSKIYTRTGDKGQTALVGGTRVNKWDTRLEAYGTIDELNSFLGWLLQMPEVEEEVELLRFVQNKLFVIGSYLATDVSFAELRDASKLKVDDVLRIEQRIDELDAQLPKITNFILPEELRRLRLLIYAGQYVGEQRDVFVNWHRNAL